MANLNQYMEWSKHRQTLDDIITNEAELLKIITSSQPSSPEFQETQQKVISVRNYICSTQQERKTYIQQEKIDSATHTLETLTSTLHTRFLSYYNIANDLPKTLLTWDKEQNTEKKQHFLELILNQCQTYQHTTFFQQTILPHSYTLNTFYNDLALLAKENNTLLPEYASIEHVSELYLFRKKVETIIQHQKPEQLAKKHKLSNSSVETKVLREISQKYYQSIQQDIETVFKNPPLYFSEQKKIKKEIEKIGLITTRIINTPIQLSEKYISSLCSTSIEEEKNEDLGTIYLKENLTHYHKSKDILKKAIYSKKYEISQLIVKREKSISSNVEQATHLEIKQYCSEIKQLRQYANMINNEPLKDTLSSLETKIDRYQRFYETAQMTTKNDSTTPQHKTIPTPIYKQKIDVTDKEPITYTPTSINQPTTKQPNSKTAATEKNSPPPFKSISFLLDFAYESSQQTTDQKFQEFCITLAGYDGKRYSTIPLSTRLQQAKNYDLKGLTEKDQQVYDHILKNIPL